MPPDLLGTLAAKSKKLAQPALLPKGVCDASDQQRARNHRGNARHFKDGELPLSRIEWHVLSAAKGALAGHPGRASAHRSPGLTHGGSCHAHTIDPRPASAAGGSDFSDHAVRLRKWCGGEGLGRRCNQ